MTTQTARKLIKLNQDFYNRIGKYWNHNQNYYWQGWQQVIDSFKPKGNTIRVLDLGCGNGRFYFFLKQQLSHLQINYTGIDNSRFLLDIAQQSLSKEKSFRTIKQDQSSLLQKLFYCDLLLNNWPKIVITQKFDLIVAFGLLHNIPSTTFRTDFLQRATELLSLSGRLVFTTWRFRDIDRLKKRIVNLDSNEVKEFLDKNQINKAEFEENDFLLDWVKLEHAYRYSHAYCEKEIAELTTKSNLKILNSFLADGRSENQNEYFICGL